MEPVPLWRLHVMRAVYLIIVLGLAAFVAPVFFAQGPALDHMHGVVCAMLMAVAILAAIGLRHPVMMLPVLLFEVIWKLLWMLVVPLPLWLQGEPLAPAFAGTVSDNLFGLVLVPLAIPWRYVWRRYVTAPGERWRATTHHVV